MKVSEINRLLKSTRTSPVSLNEEEGKIIFNYLLKTYQILSEKDIDKGRKLGERYTILLNSGDKISLSHTANYRRSGNTSHSYTMNLLENA